MCKAEKTHLAPNCVNYVAPFRIMFVLNILMCPEWLIILIIMGAFIMRRIPVGACCDFLHNFCAQNVIVAWKFITIFSGFCVFKIYIHSI